MVWRRTTKWRPAKTGTASGGFAVENSESGEVGFAKPTNVFREKLVSDIAQHIGVPVPKVALDGIDETATAHAISLAYGSESMDVPLVRDRLVARFDSVEIRDAFRRASGLLAFYAWLAVRDLKEDHLLIATESGGGYSIAAIDFADTLQWTTNDGGTVDPPPNFCASLTANIDRQIVAATVVKIEATSESDLRELIAAIPPALCDTIERERVIQGLMQRRMKVRQAMQSQGWL